jgi:hypothetical protein
MVRVGHYCMYHHLNHSPMTNITPQATVSMSSLLIFSSIWLRKKFYEVFLLMHIILSVVVIVSLF